jgi:hypothetical protein
MITLFVLPAFKADKPTDWISVVLQCIALDAIYILPAIL